MELVQPVLPYNDREVQEALRLLSAPIVVFAETVADRRQRLYTHMVEGCYANVDAIRQGRQSAAGRQTSAASHTQRSSSAASVIELLRRSEPKLTEATPQLVSLREKLLPVSFERAERRIARLKEAFLASASVVRAAHRSTIGRLRSVRLTKSVRNIKVNNLSSSDASASGVGCLCVPFTSCAALATLPETIVTGAADGIVTLWNTVTCRPLVSASSCCSGWGRVQHVEAHPTQSILFSTTMFDRRITIWRYSAAPNSAAISGQNDAVDATLERVVMSEEQHSAHINHLAVDPTGTLLASSSNDGTVALWDITSGTGLCHLMSQDGYEEARGVLSVRFHPDCALLATTDRAGRVVVWDVRSGSNAFTAAGQHGGHLNVSTCVAWSPCGVQLASGGADNLVHIWDARRLSRGAAEAPCILVGHKDVVTSVEFYANPSFSVLPTAVVSTSLDGTLRLWDTDALGSCVQVLQGPAPVRAQCRPVDCAGNTGGLVTIAHSKYWSLWDYVADGQTVNVNHKETEDVLTVSTAPQERSALLGVTAEKSEGSEDKEEDDEEDEMGTLRRQKNEAVPSPCGSELNLDSSDEDEMSALKRART
ncbi:pre mRNA processing factor 4 (PRP4) like WD domain [Trypanosoma vivax]